MPINITNSSATYTVIGTVGTKTLIDFVPIVVFAFVATGFILAVLSFEWFKRFAKAFEFLGVSFSYFLKGLLTLAGVYSLAFVLDSLKGLSDSGVIPPEYYIYALGGYATVAVIGWVANKAWLRLKQHDKKMAKVIK